jgi:prolyl 4-hydroxylase
MQAHLILCVIILILMLFLASLMRILRRNRFKIVPKTQPFGELIDERIDLRYIRGFITPEQCHHLIELAKDKASRSQVIVGKDTKSVTEQRTSHSFAIPAHFDDVVADIERKASGMVNATPAHVEGLQVVRYQPGDYFKQHHDFFVEPYRTEINNQRQYTFFVYLNDVNGGGETEFPHLNRAFQPKMGDAVFWRNCTSVVDSCHDEALHQGKAPLHDIKYGLNIWIRFYPS